MIPRLIVLLLCFTYPLVASAASLPRRPNVVFLLTDDQGYGDISAHGNPILKTPNLDRLHNEGVRFTDFHVSPTCSPTRSALMTGRHEFRNGVTHTILERERLTPTATTIAQVLKSAGYTTGIFGKWHLGDEPDRWPSKRGFDEMFIHGAGGIGQTYPGSCGDAPGNTYFDPAILHNGKFEKTRGYCTDVFFGQAMKWIESVKGQRRPFFCYLPTNAPHTPLQVRPEDEARYAGKVPANTAKYFGMVANIDDNVGRLLAKLDEWGLTKNTLVVFMNDNGGTGGVQVFNAGMRGSKNTPWLGGTRASSFWRWPGVLKPGEVARLAAHIDFFPTLAELAGARLSDDVKRQVEGCSLVPLLTNPNAEWSERTLFTHIGRWPKGADRARYKYAQCSVRTPRWHLVCEARDGTKRWQLFDVIADAGEQTDLAPQHPEVVARLDGEYDLWWDSVQPQMVNEAAVGPTINPFHELYYQQFGGKPSAPPPRPHVVFLLADDLGHHDVGFMGGKEIKTPHLDRLAAAGARLDQFYVQPVCTPTRAALMTGRYPMRYGLQVGVIRPWATYGLPLAERMLPQALRDAGYETALVGKWHLGNHERTYLPTQRGFDHQYGHYFGALDYFTHVRDNKHDWHRNDQPSADEGYTTHLLAREAVRRIRERDPRKPLFLYVPFNAVHAPHQVPETYKLPYAHLKEPRRTYAGMLAAMDEAVGQIAAALDETGLRRQTLIVFSSDNGGPAPGRVTDNGPLRAGKGTLYEGGVRVCAFVTWDGKIPAGSVVNGPLHMVDWYPTLLKLAGGQLTQPLPLDGVDLWPTLAEGKPSPRTEILHNTTPNNGALRVGDFKLIVNGGRGEASGATAPESLELFNLAEDPGETRNLATQLPERVKELRTRYQALARQAVPPKNREGVGAN